MKASAFIICVLLCALNGHCQTKIKSEDQLLFDQAFELYEDEELDTALTLFHKFLVAYPKSSLYPRVDYNVGYIYKELGDLPKAKAVFLRILKSNYNESEKGGPGGGIMADPHALYKHRSCEHLADMSLTEGDYEQAEKYIRMFDKKYPYKHFCGNELAAYEIYKANAYAKVYVGKGYIIKAIKVLLPHTFDNGLASNTAVVNRLIRSLEQTYTAQQLRAELEKAKQSLRLKSTKYGEKAIVELFGEKVEVHDEVLYRLDNPTMQDALGLEGIVKYQTAMAINELFAKHGIK